MEANTTPATEEKRKNTIKRLVRQSHERQFNGEDYQAAAWDLLQGLEPPPTDDELAEVESSPDPGCECGFCSTAPWRD